MGVARAVSAFGVLFFDGAHSRLRLDRFVGVADDGSGLPERGGHSINEFAAVGSRSNATASEPAERSGLEMPPPRHLVPLGPDHTASPPAFDTTSSAPRLPASSRVRGTMPPAPPPVAESSGDALRPVGPAIGPCWLALPPPSAWGKALSSSLRSCGNALPRAPPADRLGKVLAKAKTSWSTCSAGNMTVSGHRPDRVRSRSQQGQVSDSTLFAQRQGRSWGCRAESAGKPGSGVIASGGPIGKVGRRFFERGPAIPRPWPRRCGIG